VPVQYQVRYSSSNHAVYTVVLKVLDFHSFLLKTSFSVEGALLLCRHLRLGHSVELSSEQSCRYLGI
jgi:hypothetical protein